MCHWPLLIRSSNFKLQAPTTQGNNVFWRTTRSLFPSRWASWGGMRPSSREYSAAHVRFNERKDSSKFFKASNCAHTPYQDTQTCVAPMLDSTNVRILQAPKNLAWCRKLSMKAEWMHCCSQTKVQTRPSLRAPRCHWRDFQFWMCKTIMTKTCKVEVRLKIDIYTKIDKFLVVVPKLWLQYMTWELLLYSLKQRYRRDRKSKSKSKLNTFFFAKKGGGGVSNTGDEGIVILYAKEFLLDEI